MKLRKFFVVLNAVIFAMSCAHAQSPREQLSQLVAQLQASSGDTALRERIIKLAQDIKPSPAVPEEAERRLGRGRAAFETAKEAADFEKAIAEFTAAANAAPWLAAPYYNLGLTQEKAKRYREAMASMRLYLLASPGSPDTSEVRQKIFSLEYLAEQPPPPPPKQTDEQLLARVNGARFVRTDQHVMNDSRGDHVYEVQGKTLLVGEVIRQGGSFDRQHNRHKFQLLLSPLSSYVYKGGMRWEQSRQESCPEIFINWPSCEAASFEISPDGRTLTRRWFNFNTRTPNTAVISRTN